MSSGLLLLFSGIEHVFNVEKLLLAELEMFYAGRVFDNLLGAACADKHGCHRLVAKHPRKRHLRQALTPCGSDFIKPVEPRQHFLIELMRNVGIALSDSRICGDTVKISVCEKPLIQRREHRKPYAVFLRERVKTVALNPAVKHSVGRLIYNKRRVKLLENRHNLGGLRAVVVGYADIQRLALPYRVVKR